MGDFIKTQNSFADGEVSQEFFARDNLNGLSKLENMYVLAGGGLSRRPGLVKIADIDTSARLISFSVSENESYLIALTDEQLSIFSNGEIIKSMIAPWKSSDLSKLQYAQRFGTMIFVHPDYRPYILKKVDDSFDLSQFDFSRNDDDMSVNIPFMRFDDSEGIKITVTTNSSGNNFATFKTDKNYWVPEDVDGRFLLLNKQWTITEYIDSKTVTAHVNSSYTVPDEPVSDWFEAAFSTRRGWPCSITFHQDRLVFGGSRSWPSGVWMSKVGKHNNFDVGTGLDDEAIFITLLSEQRQQICTVVSSDNLQILTSAGEWAISSKPLTPAAVDIKQHTSVGSVVGRYLPPQKIEGATVFISGSKKDIRELSLDQLGENYNATDLCALSKHLMKDPVDLAYNDLTRQLFVIMESGDMAVLNQNSALGISAWGTYKTQGKFISVAVIDGETFVVVLRQDEYSIEKFSNDALQDAGKYGFSFTASALPVRASGHNANKIRLRKICARVLDTKTLFINGARTDLPNDIYDETSNGYSGDVCVNLLGCQRNCIDAPWSIKSSEQLPATVLSVSMYGYYLV